MYSKHIGCNYFCTVLFIKYYKPSALMKSNDLFLLGDGGANVYIYVKSIDGWGHGEAAKTLPFWLIDRRSAGEKGQL